VSRQSEILTNLGDESSRASNLCWVGRKLSIVNAKMGKCLQGWPIGLGSGLIIREETLDRFDSCTLDLKLAARANRSVRVSIPERC
jgi:hypothetical protein